MKKRILFVDDEQNILDGLRRQLRKTFSVETALGPVEGLQAVSKKGPFAVVVSDLRMPVLDGIKFLIRVKERTPDSVRMILTGNADQESAIKAVNDGHVFEKNLESEDVPEPSAVMIEELRPGMIVNEDVRTVQGLLLVAAGQELGPAIIERLSNFKRTAGNIPEPIQVLTPVKK